MAFDRLFFSMVILLSSATAFAADRMVISVESRLHFEKAWAQKTCAMIHEFANTYKTFDSICVKLDDMDELSEDRIGKAEREKSARFHVQLRQRSESEYKFMIQNLSGRDDEFKKAEWTLTIRSEKVLSEKIQFLMQNLMAYEKDESKIKAFYLAGGLSQSKRIKVNEKGEMIDVRTHQVLTDEEAYEIFESESPKHKHYLRAASELGIVLGIAAANYWQNELLHTGKVNHNVVDWDYYGVQGQKDKYRNLHGFRMDDNSRGVNEGHAFAGMVYYQVARANGLSTMESFLATFASSALWESVNEYREVFSINDQVLTTVGGFVIGETLHQFARYFYSKGIVGKTLSTLFDSPDAMNRLINRHTGDMYSVRNYGFDPDAFGYVDAYVGIGSTRRDSGENVRTTVRGIHGEIINIPLHDQPGRVHGLYTDTVLSELLIQGTQKNDGFTDFQAFAKVVFAAYHEKNIGLDQKGRRNGYSFFVGLASAAEMDHHDTPKNSSDPSDWHAVINVIGPTLDVTALVKDVKLRMTIDVYGDFAMVRSYAIDVYRKDHPAHPGEEATMYKHDYYYAMGLTTQIHLSAEMGRWSAGLLYKNEDYRSLNMLSRNHEVVTDNLKITDTVTNKEAYVQYKIGKKWKVRVSYSVRERTGDIAGTTAQATEKKVMGTLAYVF
jgi:hypothetical protein